MQIRVLGDLGGPESVSDKEIIDTHVFVLINPRGVMTEVESEARARYYVESAHAGRGWSWGLLIRPRIQGKA